eukprot:411835-Ditylum_brightwellii.AAC.1
MHGPNRTHNTKDCFELNQCAKANPSHTKADKVSYKDSNEFINAKVTPVLKKAKSHQKRKKARKITINAFNKFCNLKIDSSNEESNPEVNALAAASNDNSNSDASRVPSKDSKNDDK